MKIYSLVSLLLVTVYGAAQADTFTLNSSAGVWSGVTPVGSATGVGTASIRWGTPAGPDGQSGYDYIATAPPPVPEHTETAFQIGTFVHINQPVLDATITGATLQITLQMMFGATPVTETFSYNFEHVETPNSTPCQFGAADGATNTVPCDDRVRVLNSIPNQTFTIGGTTYTLDLLGFSKDGGTTISNTFFTTEDANNRASLFGEITSNFTPAVPEPSSVILLISAAAISLGAARKRIRKG